MCNNASGYRPNTGQRETPQQTLLWPIQAYAASARLCCGAVGSLDAWARGYVSLFMLSEDPARQFSPACALNPAIGHRGSREAMHSARSHAARAKSMEIKWPQVQRRLSAAQA